MGKIGCISSGVEGKAQSHSGESIGKMSFLSDFNLSAILAAVPLLVAVVKLRFLEDFKENHCHW